MRVIVCGAGQVGFSIAAYLARENNDVTVIDNCPDKVERVNTMLDANGVLGSASSPDILLNAGANDADMIIAVTSIDEVNMVACQVAHSLFNVPKKVARIRQQVFKDPVWANLFSRAHMPIDYIVSPEDEVAKAVSFRLSVPGTTSVVPLRQEKAFLCSVLCEDNCPIVNTSLSQLISLFPDIKLKILTIIRKGKAFVPKSDDQMLMGDEVFFVVEASQMRRALSVFGHEEQKARDVVIVGGGNIGHALIREIINTQPDVRLKVIESDPVRALALSEEFENILVLEADGVDREVMAEINMPQVETLIAVTNNDETNILTAMMALNEGCDRVIPLVNKTNYDTLTGSLGLLSVISPRAITVSSIMRHVRRGRVKAVHDVANGFAEVLEIGASESSVIVNTPIKDIKFPAGVVIAAIIRDGVLSIPDGNNQIRVDDHVIVLAVNEAVSKVEKMFSAQVALF
ncbi:MAG: Trk system potassium transporter TrkA [Alphaproteobacteria bacterium]|nr:Trk system potassium transporter TrkA [Alphaproteobacteria bacterium]NCQ88026.1 Trk system potassium transporter TrkA [Alphaproteobacteria bacterium]NCT05467.1 Trk system potassium transporter TrkA [Alphaproteobacteria bacterium]